MALALALAMAMEMEMEMAMEMAMDESKDFSGYGDGPRYESGAALGVYGYGSGKNTFNRRAGYGSDFNFLTARKINCTDGACDCSGFGCEEGHEFDYLDKKISNLYD